ncbi:hypothetical protein AAVH_25829, partial [Aphelenchoides avenae]
MIEHIDNLEKNALQIFSYKTKDRARWPTNVRETLTDHFGELYHGYSYRGSSSQRDDVFNEVLTLERQALFVAR